MNTKLLTLALTLLTLLEGAPRAAAQGTTFSFHGKLTDAGAPANGVYDLQFILRDSETGPGALGPANVREDVPATNGMFMVALDFGAGVFTGPPRWLEIGVRPGASTGSFTILTPRDLVLPTPYAIYAGSAGTLASPLSDALLPATVVRANSNATLSGTISFSPVIGPPFTVTSTVRVSNLNADLLDGLDSSAFALAGHTHSAADIVTGTLADGRLGGLYSGAVNFISPANIFQGAFNGNGGGLTNLNAGNLVGSVPDSRLSSNVALLNSGPVFSGSLTALGDVVGARLKIGQDHTLTGSAATIAGGQNNTNGAFAAAIGGGNMNAISPGASSATIAGGSFNAIQNAANDTAIGGGLYNTIQTNADESVIGGGAFNTIGMNVMDAVIGGGFLNYIQNNADESVIGGGTFNTIAPNASDSTISGGTDNQIINGAQYATIPGGQNNSAGGDFSLAAGQRAQASHDGAFVWADTTGADFASTAPNQFLIRASGGVGIGLANPVAALDVAGTVRATGFAGNGAGLTTLNASQFASGTLGDARLSANVPRLDANQTFTGVVSLGNPANSFTGNGAGLTALNGSQLASGTVADARLSANVPLLNGSPAFAGTVTAASFRGPGAMSWQVVSGTAQQAQPNRGYLLTNDTQVIVTLPTSPNPGDVVRVSGSGAGGWRITQNASQSVLAKNLPGNFGTSWTPRESNRGWTSVASSADGTKLVAVDDGFGLGGQIYTATDSGASWTPRESNRRWASVASSSDGTKLVAVGGVNLGLIYTSSDSGVSWTPRVINATNLNGRSVASSANGTKLVALLGGSVYTSSDSGVTWTVRGGGVSWQSVASSADGTKLVAVDTGIVDDGAIWTSTDSGVTWTPRESSRQWISVASSADGSKLVAVVQEGQIYTSTDSGVSWAPRESARLWRAVASSADGSKLVVVVDGGQIYTSTDSGVTWTPRESNRSWASVTSSADGSKLVAVAQGGQIYTYSSADPPGATGYLLGDQLSAIELQHIGNGQFMPLSHEGTIIAY